jgi:hypothetical protein
MTTNITKLKSGKGAPPPAEVAPAATRTRLLLVDDVPRDTLAWDDADFAGFRAGWLCPAVATDATLTAACESGHTDSCARRCEVLRDDHPVLVREADRAAYDRILIAMALQTDVAPHWYVVLSTMDSEQLVGFEQMLTRFIPPLSEAGAKATVPGDLRERFPILVEAILRSPQVDAKKIKYWFGRLPDMTQEQRVNLLASLSNQSWVIPGEPGKSPHAFVEQVRLQSGGLSPAWTG